MTEATVTAKGDRIVTRRDPRRIALPGGHWAELRDPMEITKGVRARATKASLAEATEADLPNIEAVEVNDLALLLILEGWSFEAPLPKTVMEMWEALPMPVYNTLKEAATEAARILYPEFGSPEKPDSPTVPSDV